MRNTLFVLVAVFMGAAVGLGGQRTAPESPEVALQSAINQELVTGDVAAAVARYRVIADQCRTTAPAVAARALVQLAASYEKRGQADATRIYEEILRVFPDQQDAVAIARARLRGSTNPPPAEATGAVASGGSTLKALPDSNVLPGNVSADGRLLVFSSWDDGQVYVRNLQTGADRVVTRRTDYSGGIAAISRDGAAVAYQWFDHGCEERPTDGPALCLVSLSSRGVPAPKTLVHREDIVEVAPMDWSPDGGTIAVTLRRQDRAAQVGLVSVSDGSLRVLQSMDWRGATRVFFSRDGRHVVFDAPISDASDDRKVVMLAADGTRGTTIIDHPSVNLPMGWTPDGSALLFVSDRTGSASLWMQPVAEAKPAGHPALLRSNIGGGWSLGVTTAGALYFAAREYDRDISVAALELGTGSLVGAPVRPIRRFVGTNSFPAWSPDGRRLAYVSQRGFDPTNNTGRLVGIRDMATGEERELRPPLLYFSTLSWSPDHQALLTAGTDTKGRSGLFTIDTRTGEVTPLADASINAQPTWSRDGRYIYYRQSADATGETLRHSPDGWRIVERDLGSGAERVVVAGNPGYFALSPDERFIAAPHGDIDEVAARQLIVTDIRTGEARVLLQADESQRLPTYLAPMWTAGGDAVLVRLRAPSELWLVPVNGEPRRKLDVDVSDWSFGQIGQTSLSPDGRQIAFLTGALSNELMVLEHFLPPAHARR